MLTQIGDLKIPHNITSKSSLVARIYEKRSTANGRLVTKAPVEKWESEINLDDFALEKEFQSNFYLKCKSAFNVAIECKIISPYDDEEKTVMMKCTEYNSPNLLQTLRRLYTGVSATFEEV